MRRYALRDDQWDRIKDFLPGREGHVGGADSDDVAIKIAVRRIGPALVFERLWQETGCRAVIAELAGKRKYGFALERAVFLTVLHRLFVSGSDRAADRWREDYAIADVAGLDLHHLYRTMAWLGEELPEQEQDGRTPFAPRCRKDVVEERLFAHRRDLLTRLDLVFMDTTSLYFEGAGGQTLGRHGYSKDHRPDLRQMILAVLIDGDGRPVCSEMWPGNTADVSTFIPVIDRLRRRKDDNDPLRSPYTPKQAHQRVGTEQHPVENERDPLRSPYAPKQARAQPAIVTSDFAAGDDAVRAPGGLHEQDRRDGSSNTALEEAAGEYPVDLEGSASGQPAPNSGRHEQSAADRRDKIMSDHDFERLEASLRWLQRQESAMRPPRATNLAPVPGLASVGASGRRQSGEQFGDRFRSPRSLEPDRLRLPPEVPRHNIGVPVGIVVAIILVATMAYYFAMGGRVPPSEPAPAPQTASSDPTLVAVPSLPISQQSPPPPVAQEDDRVTSAQSQISSQRTKTSQPARSSEGEAVAVVQPAEPGAQVPPASKATRVLDPEEIKLLVKQGEQFIAAGDVVTARIVFQRAADAGDAGAAVALGGTYDPIVLAKLGVVGLGADVERARTWYQKAESLGSAEAARRLAILANR